VLSEARHAPVSGVEDVLAADATARDRAHRWLRGLSAAPARQVMGT
jgi:hypothetical protein